MERSKASVLLSGSSSPAAFTRPVRPQETDPFWCTPPFDSVHRQAEVQQKSSKERPEVKLARIMRQHGVGMWFSAELQVTTPVPEWDNQPVRMAMEEEAEITAEGEMRWVLRRQTELHLVH